MRSTYALRHRFTLLCTVAYKSLRACRSVLMYLVCCMYKHHSYFFPGGADLLHLTCSICLGLIVGMIIVQYSPACYIACNHQRVESSINFGIVQFLCEDVRDVHIRHLQSLFYRLVRPLISVVEYLRHHQKPEKLELSTEHPLLLKRHMEKVFRAEPHGDVTEPTYWMEVHLQTLSSTLSRAFAKSLETSSAEQACRMRDSYVPLYPIGISHRLLFHGEAVLPF